MGIWDYVLGSIILIAGIVISILVTKQESPKQGGITALTGGDSFLNQNMGRTKDAMLAKGTKIAGIVLFAATIALYTIISRAGA